MQVKVEGTGGEYMYSTGARSTADRKRPIRGPVGGDRQGLQTLGLSLILGMNIVSYYREMTSERKKRCSQ